MDRVGSADGVLFEGFRFDQRGGCLFRLDQGGVPTPVALGLRALNLLDTLPFAPPRNNGSNRHLRMPCPAVILLHLPNE